MDDLTDLYEQTPGVGKPWLPGRTPEQLEWLGYIARQIRETGREPALTWAEIHRRFAKRWPGDAPKRPDSISEAVRRLVSEMS